MRAERPFGVFPPGTDATWETPLLASAPMKTAPALCPLDCPDACSLEVTVDDGRVARIGGSSLNPLTAGFICSKVKGFGARVHGPERLTRPMVRDGAKGEGRFRPVSWDEALDLAADRLARTRARSGGEAILPFSYGGSNGMLTEGTLDARLFRRLGASRLERTACAAPSGRAQVGLTGKMPGVALPDYEHARLIVIWGCNPSDSGIHLVPPVTRALKAGARLVVVDPRRIPLADKAALHLRVRPGTDLPVALSLLNWFFATGRTDKAFVAEHTRGADELARRAAEWSFARAGAEAGVDPKDLERLAAMLSNRSPAVIRIGWGTERNRNGGSAVAALIALAAVAGKMGVRGGGYTMSNSGAWRLDAAEAVREPEPPTRVVNMVRLGRALAPDAAPRTELLFVYDGNPLATMPDQEAVRAGLAREDLFTIVHEQVMTDTARYADLLLPATTFLEHRELARGYGAYVLQAAGPVLAPVGEARSNVAVFGALLTRLGLARPGEPMSEAELEAALVRGLGQGPRLAEELAAGGLALPAGGAAPVQMVDVFPGTPDRKIDLVPAELDREAGGLYRYRPDPATAAYPLALISPATGKTISSTLGELVTGEAELELAASDARARGIADFDEVRVFNALGEVRVRARVVETVRPGVCVLPKGLWARHTRNGATSNALIPQDLTDLGGGPVYNDARVQVARA